jgi:DNA-binding beta-propeller fold protein YncE
MKHLVFAIVIAVARGCLAVAEAGDAGIRLTQTIPLPGVEGRIDHFARDTAGDTLFVCALGNNSVEVIDLRRGERIRSITGLGSPQGVAYIPQLNRLFIANDKRGVCKIYDSKSYRLVGEINFKDDADNVRYDEATKKSTLGLAAAALAL